MAAAGCGAGLSGLAGGEDGCPWSWLLEAVSLGLAGSVPGGHGRANGQVGAEARSRDVSRQGNQQIRRQFLLTLLPLAAFNHCLGRSVSIHHPKLSAKVTPFGEYPQGGQLLPLTPSCSYCWGEPLTSFMVAEQGKNTSSPPHGIRVHRLGSSSGLSAPADVVEGSDIC